MRTSVIPGFADVADALAYIVANPYLFVSSSTVMTSGLIALTLLLRVAALRSARAARLQAVIATPMVLVLAYFGIGSMALASFLYVRLHSSIPLETEIQMVSGIGHFAVAVAGVALLAGPALRARGWLVANLVAAAYWILQIAVVRPPWLEFQAHGPITRTIAFAALGASALLTCVALRRSAAQRGARTTSIATGRSLS
ncbi:MAG TPA: hypothetical protein VFM93_07965 [Candidatus Limnocylindria bacterium]|nr:hypothetical protein [Candidatus Limnocylindria bacterium]